LGCESWDARAASVGMRAVNDRGISTVPGGTSGAIVRIAGDQHIRDIPGFGGQVPGDVPGQD
jgi:hypothetical protein